MQIPIQRYFRVLVVGEEPAPVAKIIEEELGFRTAAVGPEQAREAIHGGADLCAIVVDRSSADLVLGARKERGFEMPVFLISERGTDVFNAPYLPEVRGVVIAGLESRDFYKKTLLTAVEDYVQSLLTPVLRQAAPVRLRRQPLMGLSRPSGRPDVQAPPGRQAVLRPHGRERLSRRHLQRDGVARRSADPRRPGIVGAAGGGPDLRRRPDLFRAQRHLELEQGGQHRPAPRRRHRPVRPQQSQVEPPGRADDRGRDPDLSRDRPQRLRHGRADRLGGARREVDPREDRGASAAQGQRRRQARASDPGRDHRAMHLRRRRLQRPQDTSRRSATSASTFTSTRRGPASGPSIRCSRTTSRWASS